jgi:hypothetical protein
MDDKDSRFSSLFIGLSQSRRTSGSLRTYRITSLEVKQNSNYYKPERLWIS